METFSEEPPTIIPEAALTLLALATLSDQTPIRIDYTCTALTKVAKVSSASDVAIHSFVCSLAASWSNVNTAILMICC